MKNNSIEKILSEAVCIEENRAQSMGQLGFIARSMTICSLPHSKPKGQEFTRKNGNYTLTMISPKDIGLPYGSIPRLLLAWIASETIKKRNRVLVLGENLSQFMSEIGLTPTGGKKGDITRLREQMRRLFSCSINCLYQDDKREAGTGFRIAKGYDIWWHPQKSEQGGLWESTLTLSEEFYEEVTKSPIPIDLRALKALKRSPLALDIYIWLTFRISYLKSSTLITWGQLQMQFGAEYGRARAFKESFIDALRKVQIVYPDANITINDKGILLESGATSIPKKRRKTLVNN